MNSPNCFQVNVLYHGYNVLLIVVMALPVI